MSTTLAPRLRYHESLFNELLEGCKSGVYKGITGMHVSVAIREVPRTRQWPIKTSTKEARGGSLGIAVSMAVRDASAICVSARTQVQAQA